MARNGEVDKASVPSISLPTKAEHLKQNRAFFFFGDSGYQYELKLF